MGGLAYKMGVDARRFTLGCKFRIFSLTVLGLSEENDIMCTSVCSREGLVSREEIIKKSYIF